MSVGFREANGSVRWFATAKERDRALEEELARRRAIDAELKERAAMYGLEP